MRKHVLPIAVPIRGFACIVLALGAAVAVRAPSFALERPPAGPAACEDPIEVELVMLTSIDWKPGAQIPEEIRKLDGKRIRIKGVMAMGTVEGVDSFQLVNDGCACGTTKVQHCVDVKLADDTTEYTPDEITVTGTFSVGEVEEDGFVVSLYRLADATYE